MIAVCRLQEGGWCLDCKRLHLGHTAELARDPSIKGQRYRALWRGLPKVEAEPPKPLLRSLPLAKQCQHLGKLLDRTKCGSEVWACKVHGTCSQQPSRCSKEMALCQACTLYKPSTLRSVQSPPSVHHENPASRAGYSWREPIHFDQHNLPGPAGLRFNPSIIASGDGFLFVYRTGWAGSDLYAVRLNRDFQPVSESVKLHVNRSGSGWGREDPRLFRLNGKLHVMFIGVIGKRGPTNVLFARINEETLEVEDRFFPQGFKRNSWEKNHGYFDFNGTAHAVYSINPHKILRIEGSTGQFVHETPYPGQWLGGYMRGGAAPVFHNGQWYHFFHGKWDNHRVKVAGQSAECKRRHVYNIGVYTFSPEPPFNVLRWCTVPIDVAEPDMTDGNYCDCLFPGGAVLHDGQWAIAMGVNDRRSEIRFYPADWIERQLYPQ